MKQLHQARNLLFLILPGFVFLAIFFLLPLLFILGQSFTVGGRITFDAYIAYLSDFKFLDVYLRTLKFGFIVTALAALISYPAAYAIRGMEAGRRSALMSIVILPLMTSPVARTYAWIIILGRFGLINEAAKLVGLSHEPMRLMYTGGAVVVGLLQLFMPLMVLNLVSAMENIPDDVEEAALSLGASRVSAFFRVIVPLSADGLVMGGVLVFTGSITAYVTPAILGGTSVLTLATLMQQEAMVFMNWTGATIVAVVMVATTLVLYVGLRKLRPRLG